LRGVRNHVDKTDKEQPKPTPINSKFFPRHFGAGEGIRTLDPNLGKVVLYH
jgi:hypothetical protein